MTTFHANTATTTTTTTTKTTTVVVATYILHTQHTSCVMDGGRGNAEQALENAWDVLKRRDKVTMPNEKKHQASRNVHQKKVKIQGQSCHDCWADRKKTRKKHLAIRHNAKSHYFLPVEKVVCSPPGKTRPTVPCYQRPLSRNTATTVVLIFVHWLVLPSSPSSYVIAMLRLPTTYYCYPIYELHKYQQTHKRTHTLTTSTTY